jgi:hypothetical protein
MIVIMPMRFLERVRLGFEHREGPIQHHKGSLRLMAIMVQENLLWHTRSQRSLACDAFIWTRVQTGGALSDPEAYPSFR